MNVEEEKEELGLPGKRRIGVTLGNLKGLKSSSNLKRKTNDTFWNILNIIINIKSLIKLFLIMVVEKMKSIK